MRGPANKPCSPIPIFADVKPTEVLLLQYVYAETTIYEHGASPVFVRLFKNLAAAFGMAMPNESLRYVLLACAERSLETSVSEKRTSDFLEQAIWSLFRPRTSSWEDADGFAAFYVFYLITHHPLASDRQSLAINAYKIFCDVVRHARETGNHILLKFVPLLCLNWSIAREQLVPNAKFLQEIFDLYESISPSLEFGGLVGSAGPLFKDSDFDEFSTSILAADYLIGNAVQLSRIFRLVAEDQANGLLVRDKRRDGFLLRFNDAITRDSALKTAAESPFIEFLLLYCLLTLSLLKAPTIIFGLRASSAMKFADRLARIWDSSKVCHDSIHRLWNYRAYRRVIQVRTLCLTGLSININIHCSESTLFWCCYANKQKHMN